MLSEGSSLVDLFIRPFAGIIERGRKVEASCRLLPIIPKHLVFSLDLRVTA